MNLLHLRYFVELAPTQHYTHAAEQLCITQPSLSHAIAQMEGELGVPLFEKRGRNVALTHFGEQFLTCAQQTLATLDEGVDALRRVGSGEGVIRLGLLRTLGVDFVPGPPAFWRPIRRRTSASPSIPALPANCWRACWPTSTIWCFPPGLRRRWG